MSTNNEPAKQSETLLLVPSRSSSRKVQPSPTSTGLSGVTASDRTGSIGGISRDSNTSITGKKRNVSTASGKRSIAPAAPAGTSTDVSITTSQSAPMPKSKKSRGLLSFLNCCSAPENANEVGTEEAARPAKQVNTVPAPRTTALTKAVASTPEQKSAGKPVENEKSKSESRAFDEKVNSEPELSSQMGTSEKPTKSSDTHAMQDTPMLAVGDHAEKQGAGHDVQPKSDPVVVVEAPTPNVESGTKQNSSPGLDSNQESSVDKNEETKATTAGTESQNAEMTDVQNEKAALPLPPLSPASETANPSAFPEEAAVVDEAVEEKQKWLLPPIEPRFKGKKCLVLDLDETLVHSSFKV